MSRQDKATTERHTRTLRELVKRPENKVCSDCKHNDPRWASWNLGVFLCIRCSGIHRGMGTHISKVKSIDLDTWTPEQMESIMKWGNQRANLYWEAHLKPGHIPPDHKMESFIRSKYESRRWAMDGPPPADPSVLESGAGVSSAPAPAAQPSSSSTSPISRLPSQTLSAPRPASPLTTAHRAGSGFTSRQPQPHQLLSAQHTRNQSAARAAQPPPAPVQPAPQPAAPAAQKAPENDLFSLDFHAPSSPSPSNANGSGAAPRKDVKQDILSLFSTPSPQQQFQQPQQQQQGAFGAFASAPPAQASPWGQPQVAQPPSGAMAAQPPSGAGQWGVGYGWNAAPAAPAAPAQPNIWGSTSSTPAAGMGGMAGGMGQQAMFNTSDVWSGTANSAGTGGGDLFGSSAGATQAQKKDDVFGDIWGGFK